MEVSVPQMEELPAVIAMHAYVSTRAMPSAYTSLTYDTTELRRILSSYSQCKMYGEGVIKVGISN